MVRVLLLLDWFDGRRAELEGLPVDDGVLRGQRLLLLLNGALGVRLRADADSRNGLP